MDVGNDRPKLARTPTFKDLVTLCQHLNGAGVRYVVIGGLAVIHYGFPRGTGDIDLLVDPSPENVERIKTALAYLPDGAVRDLRADDVAQYTIVRVADEIVVDLLGRACEVTYERAQDHIEKQIVGDTHIPYLTVPWLLQTKLGDRPKDTEDRRFLEALLRLREREPGSTD